MTRRGLRFALLLGVLVALAVPGTAAAENLTITVAGAGSVTGSYFDPFFEQDIDCTEATSPCVYTIPRSFCIDPPGGGPCPPQSVTLTASPASGARFRTWGGDCSGMSSTCTLSMSTNRPVTATFLSSPLYVSPTGSTAPTAPCTQAAPCELEQTVEVISQDGDEIVVLPGDYAVTSRIDVDERVNLHGLDGSPAPRLAGPGGLGGLLTVQTPLSTIRYLSVERTSGGDAVTLSNASLTLSQLSVVAQDVAVRVADVDGTIRDSILRTTGAGGIALMAEENTEATNVTAISTGAASHGIVADDAILAVEVRLRNVIARGTAADLRAHAGASDETAVINVSYSNYRTATFDGEPGATVSVNDLGNNQNAEPIFANAAAGNFHQLPGSPTIDAGTSHPENGPTDFEGQPRLQGAAPDIGADEFVPIAAPPPADGGTTGGTTLPPAGDCTIEGTPGNDVLTGTRGNDVICAKAGKDIVRGLGGNDVIRLGAGNDKGYGGAGRDRILGGAGRDLLVGGRGRDFLNGGRGRDTCLGAGDVRRSC
jgi:hypothetical protein